MKITLRTAALLMYLWLSCVALAAMGGSVWPMVAVSMVMLAIPTTALVKA